MSRGAGILLASLVIAVATFCLLYEVATRPTKAMLAEPNCGMEWLRGEYHLTDAQFTKISKLHEAYQPACAQRCQRVADANAKVRSLVAAGPTVTPEIEAALQEWTSLQNDCLKAMLRHVYAVSAEMSPKDGERYLKMAVNSIVGIGQEHAHMMAQTGK